MRALRLLQQPQIILLREGTDTSQGKAQLISNINACMAVVDTVRTTLGPRGMDKLVHDDRVWGSLYLVQAFARFCPSPHQRQSYALQSGMALSSATRME